MYPPGWPHDFFAPWPVTGPVLEADGRMSHDERDNFHLCRGCLQELVLSASLRPAERALARRSRDRWHASRALLREAEAVVTDRTA